MRERPILFSGAMVRALLAGTKTQTRRAMKPQPTADSDGRLWWYWKRGEGSANLRDPGVPGVMWLPRCPYGRVGEQLWVRETFKQVASGEIKGGYGEVRYGYAYQADGATIWAKRPTIIHDMTGQPPTGPMQFQPRPWKPSIHMPKRASRITLEITDVRVQRLQEISEADAQAEGIEASSLPGKYRIYGRDTDGLDVDTPRCSFQSLWESINGAGSWDANPWAWALTFKRVQP
jgi:hypothetical protein